MAGRSVFGVAVAAALVAAVAACSGPAASDGAWLSVARQAPGTAALNSLTDYSDLDVFPQISSVSCASPGNCTAVGKYLSDAGAAMFVISEHSGIWEKARPLPGGPTVDPYGGDWGQPGLVSCSAPGGCLVAAGDAAPMLASQSAGTWFPAHQVSGGGLDYQNAFVSAVSCAPGAGYCAGAGSVVRAANGWANGTAFVVSGHAGTWEPVHVIPGAGQLNALSCPGPGDCLAGGTGARPFIATEANGRWGTAKPVPGLAALAAGHEPRVTQIMCSRYGYECPPGVESVSCPAPGACSIAGGFTDRLGRLQVFVASERSGTWSRAIAVPGLASLDQGGRAGVTALSCAMPGNCAAGGWYQAGRSLRQQAWLAIQASGRWGTAREVPDLAALSAGGSAVVNAVSCGRTGECVAGGYFARLAGRPVGFVVREHHGVWGTAHPVPGLAALDKGHRSQVSSISCVPGWCAAVGTYAAANGTDQFFVLNLR